MTFKIGNKIGFKHGLRKTKEYAVWLNMRSRCNYEKHKQYSLYGGRGIKICDRWMASFENFYKDMGSRPSDKHSLDRIDNNGNYEPSNCRWATVEEQSFNKRTTCMIKLNGKDIKLIDACKMFNANYIITYRRINDFNWDTMEALTKPFRYRGFVKRNNTTQEAIKAGKQCD